MCSVKRLKVWCLCPEIKFRKWKEEQSRCHMDSQRWCLLLSRCLVLYSKWGPLAQSLLAPNSHSYTSSSLKCSPNKHNKHMFSHLEPAYLQSLWIYTWSLLSIDKTNPAATKDSALLLPFGALWPRDASLCCWVKSPWYASPLCGPPFSTGRFLVLFSSGWENCVTDCDLMGHLPPIELCSGMIH